MNKTLMKKNEFELLKTIKKYPQKNQRFLSNELSWSLGKTNKYLSYLKDNKFVDKENQITEEGISALEPYKVKNAIVLAAGMSTRFAPVSYEVPKSLIKVDGEIMIERIIRQLREKGIEEIVVVVGYLMNKFLYLREKCGVKLVVNHEFRIKNTHSSIYAAQKYLDSTYIICADNFFKENVFEEYEYQAFYGAKYIKELNYERGFFVDSNNLIINTRKPAYDQLVMWGHAYFSPEFTSKFLPLLNSYYGRQGVENYYWETIYIENLNVLKMYVKIYNNNEIYEFDSIAELKEYDPNYIKHNSIELVNNICNVLNCTADDITNVEKLDGGLSNNIFKFKCKDRWYVYRIPGEHATKLIDRNRESICTNLAKELDVDNTLIYIDPIKGWKLSYYIDNAVEFDPNNNEHVILFAECLKKLHNASNLRKSGYEFNYYKKGIELLEGEGKNIEPSLRELIYDYSTKAKYLNNLIEKDGWGTYLSHNDVYEPNMLVANNRLTLIDWEFSGDNDPGYDIAKLFSLGEFDLVEAKRKLSYYFGKEPTNRELRHLFACVSVNYFYWVVWSSYMNSNGHDYQLWFLKWNDKFLQYYDLVQKMKVED